MPDQREICLIPIPFTDLTSIKKRPVLIISDSKYNKTTQDVLVMAITSNLSDRDNSVLVKQSDMESGKLNRESLIRVDKIYSINQNLIIKSFGKISGPKYKEVIESLIKFISPVN